MTTASRPEDTAAPAPDAVRNPEPAPYVERATPIWKLAQLLVRVWCSIWFDLKVYGIKNVPRSGGVLIVSNHQSYLDPLVLGARVPRPMSYMAKSELFKNSVFSRLIRSLGAFPVRQGAGDVRAIKETVQRLQEGRVLNIFPEGSRTLDGTIQPMEPGVALVVRRAHVPILPSAIDGSYSAWPKGKKIFRRHPIQIVYGPPIDVSGMKGEQVLRVIDAAIREMYGRLRSGRMSNRLAEEPLHVDLKPARAEKR